MIGYIIAGLGLAIIASKKKDKKAICVLTNGSVKGNIKFEEIDNKVKITGDIQGLGRNTKHGFHIHETGDLTEGCKSLCSHYNPHGKKHGGPKDKERHVGDLGNIQADENGNAKFTMFDDMIELSGRHSIIGRSVVIHEDEDDLGKGGHDDSLTTGHAGKRIGCGVIGIKS